MKKIVLVIGLITGVFINLFGQVPPCKKNHPPKSGGGCSVRYNEDNQGNIHGLYIEYDSDGVVYRRGNYVHGKKNGNWFLSYSAVNDLLAGEVFLVSLNRQSLNFWYENDEMLATNEKPINSKEQAIAIRAAMRAAKSKEEAEKERASQSEAAEEKRQEQIKKQKEEQEEVAKHLPLELDFRNCKTIENYRDFITKYERGRWNVEGERKLTAAADSVAYFPYRDIKSIIDLFSNTKDVNELNILCSRGNKYLNGTYFTDYNYKRRKLLEQYEELQGSSLKWMLISAIKIAEAKIEDANYISQGQISIKFYKNSYIPEPNTDQLLTDYANELKRQNVDKHIKKVIFKVIMFKSQKQNTFYTISDRASFILACNRGYKIKLMLAEKLKNDPKTKDIKIIYYPFVKYYEYEQLIMEFCRTVPENDITLKDLKLAFEYDYNKYGDMDGINIGTNGDCKMKALIENIPLKESLRYSLANWSSNNSHKKTVGEPIIPLELWDSQYERETNEITNFLNIARKLFSGGPDRLLESYFIQPQK